MGGRNLVVCLDGTGNQVATVGTTNVLKLYGALEHNDDQLTYYDPGLGTFSLAGAWTPWSRWITRLGGLAFGWGLRQNVEEAYTFLLRNWREGDRIYLFGFSRGAFTATVLAAVLKMAGVLRPGAENIIPYLCESALRQGTSSRREIGRQVSSMLKFTEYFGVGPRNSVRVEFAGLWDTVNSVGVIRRMRMPFARTLPNVKRLRHALSIDERRAPYSPELLAGRGDQDALEVWFAGVHSDVGGGYEDCDLADVSLRWMLRQAASAGVLLSSEGQRLATASASIDLEHARVHQSSWWWRLLGSRSRKLPDGARVHRSVQEKTRADPSYTPILPDTMRWED